MVIIGIAGPTASGKTTVARMLEQEFQACRTRYSEILAEIALSRGLPTDKATLQNLYVTERKTMGESFLAELLEQKIETLMAPILVIEGNRRVVDIELLRRLALRRACELRLMYVDAAPDVRFSRYNDRQIAHDEAPITREAFQKLEENPAEDELPTIREMIRESGTVLTTDSLTEEEMLHAAAAALTLKRKGVYLSRQF